MTDGRDVLTAAVDAARSDDLDSLRALVDWPMSGVGVIAQSLSDVVEPARVEVVASGLADLDAAAASPHMVEEILRPLAARLAAAREIRPAGPEEAAAGSDAATRDHRDATGSSGGVGRAGRGSA